MNDKAPAKPDSAAATPPAERSLNFLEQIIEADNASKKWGTWGEWPASTPADKSRANTPRVQTRFPPEPNGYLHMGHAKSICLNYGLAQQYNGKFNLRFDDTNPTKEDQEYVDSIIRDVKWITAAFNTGSFDSGPHAGGLYYASNYFEQMYQWAIELIKKGKAYVCELSGDEVSARRGTPTVPGTSPFRDRPAAESLKLIEEMKAGKHADGKMTVRAKIDLASPNFNLRDPILYRIVHEEHHNTGTAWCIYPMYDWAHGFEDSLEGVTHSICTLEFENHRPLYDWFIDAVNEGRTPDGSGPWGKTIHHPQQIEFAKFRPTYTVLSKRNLLKMVEDKLVSGWDDPRMPTISALRRRGFPALAIKNVCTEVGVTKVESFIDVGRVENAVRDVLNKTAPRAMAVLRPLKVTIENWPEGKVDELDYVINPEDPAAGKRKVPFSKVIYIEREDFMEVPAKKYFRLAPGAEVRLRWAYFITCTGVKKDAAGNVIEVLATYDPQTRGGDAPLGPDGLPTKKVKGTIHWVSADHAVPAEVRLFDRLFSAEHPGDRTGNWQDDLNPHSLETVQALVEPWIAQHAKYFADGSPESLDAAKGGGGGAGFGARFQFERLGYFCVDRESSPTKLVFNRTVTLKDSWAKVGKE
ncbi:MAG: glutamine--tRNA ligase/YqeY domain fusion protein [Phycisphaerales bacterium]|nr:glutamine--tRNA ligase/YqeY domain fusion protein [Phycisphaerales bacterium]